MLTDSHCHLASRQFPAEEIPDLVRRASEANISRMVTLATCLEDCPNNLALTEAHPEIFCAIGIHPTDVCETPDDYMTQLQLHAQHPRCVAIGETGLDYYHPAPDGWTEEAYNQRQQDFLRQHFELACKLGKNVVIHTRDRSGTASFDDALAIYSEFSDRAQAVFHCFLGPQENMHKVLDLGGLVSFTAISTFKSAKDCRESAIAAPAGSFMLETDAPYLAPAPHRGKRCEPGHTRLTADFIADARGESLEQLAKHTESAVCSFFKLPPL
ncbi:TatD family hydrolase [Rubritalea marina]|uniref:TatD family hydrolase n=1 Tax=Rubritalea marina TaxID=361055 RepID=UPI00036D8857|nr:TatD family hydrolase [Rubritalea marina]